MTVYQEFVSFINELTPEQVNKLITRLPELISQAEESVPAYPPEQSLPDPQAAVFFRRY